MKVDLDRVASVIRETAAAEMLQQFVDLDPGDIGEKSPNDFVTAVDLAMEARFAKRLPDLLPGSTVVGEEAVADDAGVLDLLAEDRPVWVVDPLDGTANFASGYPLFCTIVALVIGGETVAGWIYDPFSERLAAAERGGGAFMGERRLRVARPANLRDMNGAIYGYRFRASDAYREIWGRGRGRLGHCFNARCVGQEYLARLAGRVHFGLYTRLNPWDHAAGCLLHEEAGGAAAMHDGTPYRPLGPRQGLLVAPDWEVWRMIETDLIRRIPL